MFLKKKPSSESSLSIGQKPSRSSKMRRENHLFARSESNFSPQRKNSIRDSSCCPFMLFALLASLISISIVPNIAQAMNMQINSYSNSNSNINLNLQPMFTKNMNLLTVKENTQIGEVVYTLEARVDKLPQAKIYYSIEGTSLFSVDKFTGQVKVAQPIDREQTSDSIAFQVSAVAAFTSANPTTQPQTTPNPSRQLQFGPVTQITITVLILDENDNAPKIESVKSVYMSPESAANLLLSPRPSLSNQARQVSLNQQLPTIRLDFNESLPVGSTVVELIEAIDLDKASSEPLSSTCLDCFVDFELRTTTDNLLNDRLNLSLVLINQLVHIPRNNVRNLHIVVSDGKFNTTLVFEITIEDVQNKPPQFIGSTTCIISENSPIDKTIMQIQAIDGDAIGIDDAAATIMGKFGAASNQNGGRQILYDLVEPNDPSGVNLNDFKLHPLSGQLQVANRIDREMYLNSNAILTLRLRARELTINADNIINRASQEDQLYETILEKLSPFTDGSSAAQSEIDLTIIVTDLNDNEPHWLNGTEIEALNLNQSPYWFNSLPALNNRDTGRIYYLEVRENSLPGSPITSRNEMFVYDVDNGDNCVFNLTLIDPFNLFDVEPKQVNGFGLVTLKLRNNSNNGSSMGKKSNYPLLDYENLNERNFIIQLIATETNTMEKFSSKALVHINVLDVNDNAPEFKESNYHANIREDASAGKSVLLVQATDKDQLSKQLFYSLHGKSSYLFDINRLTGLISVARCQETAHHPPNKHSKQQPQKPCIDYEHQKAHNLMVEVSDGELSSKVPLTIFIDDAPDNPPIFNIPIMDAVIEEGSDRLDPPIKVEASDVDQTSALTYSIVEGNFEGLFQINNATGELQLTRPIRIQHDDNGANLNAADYRSQNQLNKITLIVQVSDGLYTTNCTIRIDVLDANDNEPKFIRPQYLAELEESVSAGHLVATVRAVDLDRGNNALISYSIQRGSYGQFEIEPASGIIKVAKDAADFDASKRENYTLEVVATDHGLVPKSSSVLVLIRILSTNKRAPQFEPRVQKTFVHESTPNNTIIYRMQIKQAPRPASSLMDDFSSLLIFEPGPIEALDKNGQPVVASDRLETMFSISTNTGDIMVNSDLDHNFAAHINLTVFVSSFSNNQQQQQANGSESIEEFRPKSIGYIIINVIDDNGNAPMFGPPWSQQQPELNFQMFEELPVGSFLTQLIAFDADSKISHFRIEPPNEYFELTSPTSGLIVNKKLIDYDLLMRQTFVTPSSSQHSNGSSSSSNGVRANGSQALHSSGTNNVIQFNVYAYDSGLPQLSAKAVVSVEILPINDWDCNFEQQIYDTRLKENPPADTLVLQVRANDFDFGEQHNSLRYQLVGEHSEFFNIDSRTGLITVSSKGSFSLDSERLHQTTLTLNVVGRDEQNFAGQQQQQPGNKWPGKLAPGNQISLNNSRTCSATIRVHIDDTNDNPPLFTQKVYEVLAYDTDIVDVPLIKLFIKDEDRNSANSKLIQNSFRIVSGNSNDSFNITKEGVLYATKAINVNQFANQQQIQLRVQVKQQQQQLASATSASQMPIASFTDECLVNVNLLKINRFSPEWRSDSQKQVSVLENSRPGTLVTQLKCTDRDYEQAGRFFQQQSAVSSDLKATGQQQSVSSSSPIRYWLKVNGSSASETGQFKLDPVSGSLITRVELDREAQEYYHLIVSCEDNGKPQSLEIISPLLIIVRDVDDNKPEFLIPRAQDLSNNFNLKQKLKNHHQPTTTSHLAAKPVVNFSIEEHQSKGLPVGELKAIDRDLEAPGAAMNYCIIEGNEYEEFYLDQITGILYTNQTLDREKQSTYDLLVKAINDGSSCETHLLNHSNNSTSSKSKPWRKEPTSHGALSSQFVTVKIDVLDINDNAPIFKRPVNRAGVHYRSLMNSLVTQVTAFDPDLGLNGTLSYKINEILMYKTTSQQQQRSVQNSKAKYDIVQEQQQPVSKPIKLVQFPFRIDQNGNLYTQQLLTQYQLMSMFLLSIDATEEAEPWRTARTKLEIYIYETSSQLKIRINLHPRLIETYKPEIEQLLSNATKYTAIINRAKSYHEASSNNNNINEVKHQINHLKAAIQQQDLLIQPQLPATINEEPLFSNIQLIFVDNFRIVNPSLVMEKFDLTSAQLFMPQQLVLDLNNSNSKNDDQNKQQRQLQINEVSSLIDKIALASVQAAEYHASASTFGSTASALVGVDWLESPSVLYTSLTIALIVIGFIIFLFSCCCTSRIKDHIVKVAMDKMVKQQNLQAKINERVMAATASQMSLANGQTARLSSNPDYALQQQQHHGAGFMSSFDATKGCIMNNNENMNILQRAMESGEYIDPNYTTLDGHVNMGAHFYDASELEQQQVVEANGRLAAGKQVDDSGSIISNRGDEHSVNKANGNYIAPTIANGNHNTQRQRQQIPDGNNN